MEITFYRAFKIWWSFTWRACITLLPLMFIMFPLMMWILPIPKPGEPPPVLKPDQIPGFMGKFFIIWIFMMIGMVFLQTLALRWMLKTKWSDFKLVAVKSEIETHPDSKPKN